MPVCQDLELVIVLGRITHRKVASITLAMDNACYQRGQAVMSMAKQFRNRTAFFPCLRPVKI